MSATKQNRHTERKVMATKKNGTKATNKATNKATPKGKGFANPYRDGSNYHAIVATLEAHALNRPMPYSEFEAKIQKSWEGWKEFATRKARKGVEVHHDALGKLFVNVGVVRRQRDYGKPLFENGACVNLTRNEKGELMIELCTKNTDQKNPGRAPSEKKEVTKKSAEKKSKAKGNGAKHKPSASATPILSGREALRHLATKGNGTKRSKAA
jgi:hypothetical protein